MRYHRLLPLIAALASMPAALAQIGLSGSASSALTSGGAVQLAQFQPGIAPRASNFDLAPGQAYRIALNCIDLFADTPTDQVAFQAPDASATVLLASGEALSLGDALTAGLLQARGRGPRDLGPPAAGPWYDVVITNASAVPLRLSIPAGTLLVPAGQTVPEPLPGIRRLLAAAQARGLLGSETLAEAVWATRGFTRDDVAQTAAAPLSDTEARRVQELLAAANLGYDFGQNRGEYSRLYQNRRASLAAAAASSGWALLPDGRKLQAEVLADAAGHALLALTPSKAGEPLYYAGEVLARRAARLTIQLIQLKTGRPLEAIRGPVEVRLAGG